MLFNNKQKEYTCNQYQLANFMEPVVWDADMAEDSDNYVMSLIKKTTVIDPKYYYGQSDFKDMVKGFLNQDKIHTQEYEDNIVRLSAHIHQLKRDILGNKHFFGSIAVIKALNTFSEYKGRNIISETAWAVVHSYLTGIFINLEKSVKIMKMISPNNYPIWNSYVDDMTDVDESVRKIFKFDTEGNCIIFERYICEDGAIMKPAEDPVCSEFPPDDECEEENKQIDEHCKIAQEERPKKEKEPESILGVIFDTLIKKEDSVKSFIPIVEKKDEPKPEEASSVVEQKPEPKPEEASIPTPPQPPVVEQNPEPKPEEASPIPPSTPTAPKAENLAGGKTETPPKDPRTVENSRIVLRDGIPTVVFY